MTSVEPSVLLGIEYRVVVRQTIATESDVHGRRFLREEIDLVNDPSGWRDDRFQEYARDLLNGFDPPLDRGWLIGDEHAMLSIPLIKPSTEQNVRMRATLVLKWTSVEPHPLSEESARILLREMRAVLEPALDEARFEYEEGAEKLLRPPETKPLLKP